MTSTSRGFLRDYWAWMVVPVVLVLAAVAALLLLSDELGGSGFLYEVF